MGMVFCRGCGKEIHESAPTCPHCGAPQGAVVQPTAAQPRGKVEYTSYDQVPWYRKNWCAFLCFFFFAPGLFLMFITGDVYYQRKGLLTKYGMGSKIFFIVWSVLWLIAVFNS